MKIRVYLCIFIISLLSISISSRKRSTTSNGTECAKENGKCQIPPGQVCTVVYGAKGKFATKQHRIGTTPCNNGFFGDPVPGTVKKCFYKDCSKADQCAQEGGNCNLPNGQKCLVTYGAQNGWKTKEITNKTPCNNGVFGDPKPGVKKACYFHNCSGAGGAGGSGKGGSSDGTKCAKEGEHCQLPAGKSCTIVYGAKGKFAKKKNKSGKVPCNNGVFGDPIPGTVKKCLYKNCVNAGGAGGNGGSDGTKCAKEGEHCQLPAGKSCTIVYGAKGKFAKKKNKSGKVPCNNGVFGDPIPGTVKKCLYKNCVNAGGAGKKNVKGGSNGTQCSKEGGDCQLPAGKSCTIVYGAKGKVAEKKNKTGKVPCNNGVFGDPIPGTVKNCFYKDCVDASGASKKERKASGGKGNSAAGNGKPAGGAQNGKPAGDGKSPSGGAGNGPAGSAGGNGKAPSGGAGNGPAGDAGAKGPEGGDGKPAAGGEGKAPEGGDGKGPEGGDKPGNGANGGNGLDSLPNKGVRKSGAPSAEGNNGGDSGKSEGPKPVDCAAENSACTLPLGQSCTVSYGSGPKLIHKKGQIGKIECNNKVFGDPVPGMVKQCSYKDCAPVSFCAEEGQECFVPSGMKCIVTYGTEKGWKTKTVNKRTACSNEVFKDPVPGTKKSCYIHHCEPASSDMCGKENETCAIPEGMLCSVKYGAAGGWTEKTNVSGQVPCDNNTFGDPRPGAVKSCFLYDCVDTAKFCTLIPVPVEPKAKLKRRK